MKTWQWVTREVVYAIHDQQMAEHGGREGLRDIGAKHLKRETKDRSRENHLFGEIFFIANFTFLGAGHK